MPPKRPATRNPAVRSSSSTAAACTAPRVARRSVSSEPTSTASANAAAQRVACTATTRSRRSGRLFHNAITASLRPRCCSFTRKNRQPSREARLPAHLRTLDLLLLQSEKQCLVILAVVGILRRDDHHPRCGGTRPLRRVDGQVNARLPSRRQR